MRRAGAILGQRFERFQATERPAERTQRRGTAVQKHLYERHRLPHSMDMDFAPTASTLLGEDRDHETWRRLLVWWYRCAVQRFLDDALPVEGGHVFELRRYDEPRNTFLVSRRI